MATSTLGVEQVLELCPRCAARPQCPATQSGFCHPCDEDDRADRYAAADAEEIRRRRQSWRDRTEGARHYDRERQRRHRLVEKMRPAELAPREVDPLELAKLGVEHLSRLRSVIVHHHLLLGDLDAAGEIMRQLAWGPGP